MNVITRLDANARMSRTVIYNGVAYVAGVTASDLTDDIRVQTRDALAKIDGYLASARTDKHRLLTAQVWLKDIARDFVGMNEAWVAWMPADAMPTRATCEARLAQPEALIEIIVSAAV